MGFLTTEPGAGGLGGAFLPLGSHIGHSLLARFSSVCEAAEEDLIDIQKQTANYRSALSLGLGTREAGRAFDGHPLSWNPGPACMLSKKDHTQKPKPETPSKPSAA